MRIDLNIYEQHRKYVFHLFPGVRLIETFLKDTDILSTLDTSNKQKVCLIKAKVFNERKSYRHLLEKRSHVLDFMLE